MKGWRPDKKLGYKLVMEGAGSKIFLEFFKEFTDSVDVARSVYPKMTAKNNYVISRYFSTFKELDYLDKGQRRKLYKKRTKCGRYKIVQSSRLCDCFRGNMKPFFEYAEEEGIVFSDFEEKLLIAIFSLDYARNTVYTYGNAILGIQNTLLDMISIRLQALENGFIHISKLLEKPYTVVLIKQDFEIIKKLFSYKELSDKHLKVVVNFVDKQVAFIDDWTKKKESNVLVASESFNKGENNVDLSSQKDKIKFYLFSLHLPEYICYEILKFAPMELQKVLKNLLEVKFKEETEYDISFRQKIKRRLHLELKRISNEAKS